MMMICFILLIFPCYLNGITTWQADLPDPFKFHIKMNTQSLSLGDSLEWEIEMDYPVSHQLMIDDLIEQLSGSANPLASEWKLMQMDIQQDNGQVKRLIVQLMPLISGEVESPFLLTTFLPKENTHLPVSIPSPIFSIKVANEDSVDDTLSVAPLIPLDTQFPLGLTSPNRELWIENPEQLERTIQTIRSELRMHVLFGIALIIVCVGGVAGGTAYLLRKYWLEYLTKPSPPISSEQQIDCILAKLHKFQIGQEITSKDYIELSSLLLEALQVRLGVAIKQLTTFEIKQLMHEKSSFSIQQQEEILALLIEIDQTKFAGQNLSRVNAMQINHSIIQQILKFS